MLMIQRIKKSKLKSKEFLRHPEGSIFEQGYGQIPKVVMCDKGLSVTAKAIYAYLSSYAGGGNQAFPGTARICSDLGISKDTFYKHFKQIEYAGYISRIQTIGDYNKFSNNIYEFNFTVDKKVAKASSGNLFNF